MELDERKLRAFLAIADSGSLGRAAFSANLTQPTLSRLVNDMENRLGQKLFDRHGRGMTLTAAGHALLPHARLLVHEMDGTREHLDALRGLRRGTVRIGSVASIMRAILPQAVTELLATSPGLNVQTLEASDDRLFDALLGREIDLAILSNPLIHDEVHRIGKCNFDDLFGVFCNAEHSLAPRPGLASVLDENWVMPTPGSTPRRQFEAIIRAAGQSVPQVSLESGSVEAMVAFVAKSRLLGWLPVPLLAPYLAMGTIRLLDVPELSLRREFFIFRRKHGMLPLAAQKILQVLPVEM